MIENRGRRPSKSSPKPSRKRRYGSGYRRENSLETRGRNVSAAKEPERRDSADDCNDPGSGVLVSDERLTGGKLAGKPLKMPFLDRSVPIPRELREALFERFAESTNAARFLDLCAGTGMVGIEAISRGAMLGTFVDRRPIRCAQIRKNLEALEITPGHGEVFEEESGPFLKRMSKRGRFWDLVFWDPPFGADYEDCFRFFAAGRVLRPKGTIAVRHHGEMFFSSSIGVLKRRQVLHFEETALSIYDRVS